MKCGVLEIHKTELSRDFTMVGLLLKRIKKDLNEEF